MIANVAIGSGVELVDINGQAQNISSMLASAAGFDKDGIVLVERYSARLVNESGQTVNGPVSLGMALHDQLVMSPDGARALIEAREELSALSVGASG